MPTIRSRALIPAAVALLLLAGCKTPEEKAEAFYLSGVEFLSAGDLPRAGVELRNALKWNEAHRDAHRAYVRLLQHEGDLARTMAAMTDYAERWPGDAAMRRDLAEVALRMNDWGTLERHAEAVLKLAPDAPEAKAMDIVLRYRRARLSRDAEARATAALAAQSLHAERPTDGLLLRVVLEEILSGPDPLRALPLLDEALALDPRDRKLQLMRVSLLNRRGDQTGAGARLMQLADLFPEDGNVRSMVVAWLIQQGDVDGAEDYLRGVAAAEPRNVGLRLDVVRLLRASKGDAAAAAELDRLAAEAEAGDKPDAAGLYRATKTLLAYEAGEVETALAAVRAVISGMGPGDERARVRVMLAGMLEGADLPEQAKAEIDGVLADHPTQIDALKTRGRWMIDADRPSEAIMVLRSALDHDPRDPGIFILLASAHFLAGNAELAGERLADATEASAYAPAESLRYVRHLRRTGRPDVAAHVLLSARARSPGSVPVAQAAADLFVERQDWAAAARVADDLARLPGAAARETALAIRVGILAAQDRHVEGLELLQAIATGSDGTLRPGVAMAAALVRAGRLERARAYVDGALAEAPEDRDLRLVSGSLHAQMGEVAAAEAAFLALAETDPSDANAVRLLVATLRAQGRDGEAASWLARGLAAAPDDRRLRMAEASRLEAEGDVSGAIALYDALHAEEPSDPIALNNLASLLATWRADDAALVRAQLLAQRLDAFDAPALRHTVGWIAYRSGKPEEALPDLRAAAAAMPGDAVVQFHYGMALASRGDVRAANARFAEAETLASPEEAALMERVLAEAEAAWAAETALP